MLSSNRLKRTGSSLLLGSVALFMSTLVQAQSSYLSTWSGIYPSSTSSDAGCQLCHASSTTYLNPYGRDMCVSTAGSITNRIQAVASANSDMDPTGASNLTEINANAQPGWTPGNVNPTYSRTTCSPSGLVEAPPTFITGPLDPPAANIPPVANANGPYSGTVNMPVNFTSTANDPDGSIVSYSWNFGDGTTGTGPAPTHTYLSVGTFIVTLTVTDNAGATGLASTTATIGLGNQPPVANAGGPYTGTTGVAVNFNGTGSTDPDGSIISYSWNFGDGATGTGATPSHTYAVAGTYNVTLQVMDDAGVTDSAATTATISAPPVNQPPVANANGPYTGDLGIPVAFSSAGSSDPDGSIVAYSWEFGDGVTSTAPNPTHMYVEVGNYTVSLTVTDNSGASTTVTTTATIGAVNQPPVANANGPYTGTVGVAVAFSSAGSSDPDGGIVAYSWNFGDGSTGSGASPTHVYTSSGTYTVTLSVTDNSGTSTSATTTAAIGAGNQPPVANAGGPYSGAAGVAVTFDGSNSSDPDGTIVSYSWSFGDGGSGSGVAPSHTYAADGTYNVTLTVTDDAGATDSAMTTVTIGTVTPPPHDGDDEEHDDDDHKGDKDGHKHHRGKNRDDRKND